MKTHSLIILFSLIITGLLIGQSLDFKWPQRTESVLATIITVDGQVEIDRNGKVEAIENGYQIKPGEIIKTGDSTKVLLMIGDNMIGLDQRSDLKFTQLDPAQIEVFLGRGRAIFQIESLTNINTNQTKTNLSLGTVTIINYDFVDKVTVAPISSDVNLTLNDNTMMTNRAVDILEMENRSAILDNYIFDPSDSAAKEFYEWFNEASKTTAK